MKIYSTITIWHFNPAKFGGVLSKKEKNHKNLNITFYSTTVFYNLWGKHKDLSHSFSYKLSMSAFNSNLLLGKTYYWVFGITYLLLTRFSAKILSSSFFLLLATHDAALSSSSLPFVPRVFTLLSTKQVTCEVKSTELIQYGQILNTV